MLDLFLIFNFFLTFVQDVLYRFNVSKCYAVKTSFPFVKKKIKILLELLLCLAVC